MRRYLLRKILWSVPLLVAALSSLWLLVELRPGDACDAFVTEEMDATTQALVRARMGCDLPAFSRYLSQVGRALAFDFGLSTTESRPVLDLVAEAVPSTLLLTGTAWLLGSALGVALGVFQARSPRADAALTTASLVFLAVPGFALALALQLLFSLWWPILPTSGMVDAVTGRFGARHLVLPVLSLALPLAAAEARFARASLREVLGQDFIRTARAKGLSERRVMLRHALPNALLPMLALWSLHLPALFSGSVLVESIFGWPGMGRLILAAVLQQDVPILLACFYVYTVLVVLGGILADALAAWCDPRIRLA